MEIIVLILSLNSDKFLDTELWKSVYNPTYKNMILHHESTTSENSVQLYW
jgi:hypothetical protein